MPILPYYLPMLPKLPLHLTFLPFDGFSNMVLASAIEPLRAARDLSARRLFSWQVCSLDGGPVMSSSGLSLAIDLPLVRVGATDALILVSGYGMRDHLRRDSAQSVLKKARGLPLIGGFDTGAWLLGRMGLLAGRRSTIHWMERDAMAEAFPEVNVVSDPYVVDGNVVTCGGAQSVLSWSLDLISAHSGEALRFDVANMFGRVMGRSSDPVEWQLPSRMTNRALPLSLQRAVRAMRETAERPLALSRIAERAALSLRSMNRLFHAHLGVSSGEYYRHIRLSHARALGQETDLSLEEIASRTGYSGASTLARAYRQVYGETVRESIIRNNVA
ncbi:GlxA family transcriptional regulator [Tropicimonas sp.]|uniref:GlxA family transcriptional regulator n=1 Tax=Tropicimonas sp. TaxID=2067044 RepID=UPI003A8890B0